MRKTSAKDGGQRFAHLLLGSFRVFIEQRLGGKDYAAETESALGCAFIDKSLLNGVRFFRSSDSLEGRNFLAGHGADWRDAGAHGLPIDDDRASSALREAAAELGSTQLQLVAEHKQQRSLRIDIYGVSAAVYLQRNGSHDFTPNIGSRHLAVRASRVGY
jgi:hypothetical protein